MRSGRSLCNVLDVEREEFIYREMVNDGGIPYRQWQEKTENDGTAGT